MASSRVWFSVQSMAWSSLPVVPQSRKSAPLKSAWVGLVLPW